MTGSMAIISAHPADFVWRSGGTIAKYRGLGWEVNVLVLSTGVRGESAEAWSTGGASSYEEVARLRREEAGNAARVLGCEMHWVGLRDYPINIDADLLLRIALDLRRFRPSIIVTHAPNDPFNPDHPEVFRASLKARMLACAPGVSPEIPCISPPRLYAFEPNQTEFSEFMPDILLDITDVFEKKVDAMKAIVTQRHLVDYHIKLAEIRGFQAKRDYGGIDVKYAEAFQSIVPIVSSHLP